MEEKGGFNVDEPYGLPPFKPHTEPTCEACGTDAEALDALAEQVFIAFAGSFPEDAPEDAAINAFDWAEAFLEESKRRAGG